ncbi:hypothetical protein FE784_22605 [Paenibacillus hemerocallicola]|uniref:Uncharacterized protein n=1 Tax=Paenibacillus hemerocallicola TaxID=1172614 RepID=A0A5C4T6J3_9BACL|nr:hypothetical protein [Paenibacillus hemerocallicola]TNJ63957.1 hypothetical protein FE784_22605 [Paenibacillus hemerocallicola]
MPSEQAIHDWSINFDGVQTISLWLDGVKVAEHAGMGRSMPALRTATDVTDTIVSGNSIVAARQCIFLATGANGSDVRITQDNVFSGAGAPVGNAGYV